MHSKNFKDDAFDAAMEKLLRQFATPRQQRILDELYNRDSESKKDRGLPDKGDLIDD